MKIKFSEIRELYVGIHFSTQLQLEKLVDNLKAFGYDYGTGKHSDINEIKTLGLRYFVDNKGQCLSLDRSK